MPLHFTYFNPTFDQDLSDPQVLLNRYFTMTQWCEALAKTGKINVSVVQYFSNDIHFKKNEVEYYFINTGKRLPPCYFTLNNNAKNIFQSLNPDIVHTGGIPGLFPSLRDILQNHTAIVWQHHGGGFPTHYTRWIYRKGFRDVDAFFFTAKTQADQWIHYKLFSAQPVYEIPESSTQFSPLPQNEIRRTLGLPSIPVFLWVGHLNRNKDPLTILAGFNIVLQHNRNLRLYMAFGSDTLLYEIRKYILDNDMSDNVYLLGTLSKDVLQQWYSAADYFVLGSHHEGSGYALIEALACGVMPIVSDIPSFRTLTNNGTAGSLWSVGHPESFAQKALDSLQHPVSRSEIISYFNARLSFDAIASLAVSTYETIFQDRTTGINV